MVTDKVVIGIAPDSWGIWFAEDPNQTPADRFLDEVVQAGYEWIEIGAYGYLSTDPAKLRDDLNSRRLKVSGGTTFARLQHPGTIDEVWEQVAPIASLTAAMGAEHMVVIPDLWRDDLTGNEKESRQLSAEQWTALVDGNNELGRRLLEEYGIHSQFHSHADSHVGYQRDVERFLESTDPQFVNLCLDTGHIAYYGGDSVELITKYPDRIGYLHLKQVDPVLAARALAEDISFSKAVKMDVMVEPPSGVPNLAEVIEAATESLPHSVFAIVEQDMYPCPPDKPLPIARRTYTYLSSCLWSRNHDAARFASCSDPRSPRSAVAALGRPGHRVDRRQVRHRPPEAFQSANRGRRVTQHRQRNRVRSEIRHRTGPRQL